jgi:hypothetical protein
MKRASTVALGRLGCPSPRLLASWAPASGSALAAAVLSPARALRPAAGAPAAPAPAGARGFATDAPPVSPEVLERLRTLSEQVTKDVTAGADAMRREFGEKHAEKVWMTEYYRHGQHKYLVPAAMIMCADPALAAMPSLAVKNAVFLGTVLRSLPPEVAANYANALPLVKGMDVPFLLAVLHVAGTPAAKARFDMMGVSVRRAGARALVAAGQHIAAVPATDPATWALPHTDAGAGGLAAGDAPWPPPRHATFPWELSPVYAALREPGLGEDGRPVTGGGAAGAGLDRWQYLQLAGTTVLEALWASFYATGDAKYLRRIGAIAADWGEFAPRLPDGAIPYVISLDQPLPPGATGGEEGKRDAAGDATAARAAVSRVAVWTLLHHTRRHPGECVCLFVAAL